MANPTTRVEAAEKEAAAWHVRLGTTSIETRTIEEFFEWRARPGNADAYRRVEQVWREGQGLGSDPALAEALDGARRRSRPGLSAGRRSVLFGGLAVATAVALVVGGSWFWSERNVFATQVGEQRVIPLADGSSLRLDTDSRVRVRFTDRQRRIDLVQGQALFNVAHDAGRPFVVHAGDTRVTAVGTVFDVRRAGEGVRVTLVSGAIDVQAVQAPSPPRRIAAGQQATVSGAKIATRAVDVQAETSWATGQLVFTDIPLAQAVAEMNRYLTEKIEIDDPAIRSVAVNGVFRAGDRDAFVAASSDVMGLRAVPKADGSVGLSRRGINSGRREG
ncbi:FecR domain-containing protein [Brevundimonas aurantiaca]|uniref:FecR domain-containing protein n=1 Tax=Brevundimonas aurantiaca TaxID=74316 RepID=UPI0015FFEF59|nr:iron dicitrate transport regulator FecR [Pseudomonas sp. FW305-3-2-15-E-TSA4]